MKAYDHLLDYSPAVDLADDTLVVSHYTAGVDRTDERLRRLLAEAPAISLHDHPFRYPVPLNNETWARWRAGRRMELAYDGLAESGMRAVVSCTNSWHSAEEIVQIMARVRADAVGREGFHVVDAFTDLDREGSLGIVLGLESMTWFGHDLASVEFLYGLGVRVGGLIYSDGNVLGAGLSSATDEGLTSQGRAFVKEMNALGMAVDLAHAGDRTTLDAIEVSEVPVLVSHAGARGLWPTARMKPDDVLRALVDAGGLIGVEAAPNSTCSPKRERHDLDAVLDHLDHLAELVGVGYVALGPDVMYGRHHELHEIRAASTGGYALTGDGAQERVDFVDGVENPTEAFWNITAGLVGRGWADDDIRAVLGANARRVLEQILR